MSRKSEESKMDDKTCLVIIRRMRTDECLLTNDRRRLKENQIGLESYTEAI